MKTGAKNRALGTARPRDKASRRDPCAAHGRSVVLEFIGDGCATDAANRKASRASSDTDLLLQAAHLECESEAPSAGSNSPSAPRARRRGMRADIARCEELLALGQADRVEPALAPLLAAQPTDRYLVALRATTWRLLADPRYQTLCDYDRLVGTRTLDPPAAWNSLPAFLADVVAKLEQMHRFVAHPFQQSVRGGGQLTLSEDDMRRPLIAALFGSIAAAVQAHLAALGTGDDPMRSLPQASWHSPAHWSVRLRSGGSHVDHVHPHGWLSSACYLALPPSIGDGTSASGEASRAGWLRLGRPGIRTTPTLDADHHIQPRAGLLALFPARVARRQRIRG